MSSDNYRMFVGEEGEERRLMYNVEGKVLVITFEGNDGISNRNLLIDDTWDRLYLYFKDSKLFFPNLAPLFSKFRHVMSPRIDVVVIDAFGELFSLA